jgi:hypothetical protein
MECARCGLTRTTQGQQITYNTTATVIPQWTGTLTTKAQITEITDEMAALEKAAKEALLCIWCGRACADADDLDAHEEECSS